MPAQWLSNSSEMSGRLGSAVSGALHGMAQPENARRLRQLVMLLLALWAVLALARLIWALLPASQEAAAPPPTIINPVVTAGSGASGAPVDIQRMVSWHLFGEAGAPVEVVAPVEEAPSSNAREGIEDGARETRLNLKLRGIVASTEDGLGHAIIEYKSKQDVYAVEDKLPVTGRVTLAKVMPRQVVLDNGGTYELLVLFEDSKLGTAGARVPPPRKAKPSAKVEKRTDLETAELASGYRERLYENPQSLASVVSVSAVREDGALQGYRVRPGKDRDQFEQLGFKTGDMVTAVNGIDLSSPANTMRLYNAMRTASEAVFELQRGDQSLTLSVSLDAAAQQ